ncbi:MAG: type I-C CRISPR-associated protein Cas7/Csd2 [Thermomicrobiales bacterium]|nr:type I-C CRISPR-associated protein Cas7/Csd2 [Thermomicrobiales bacterium]
MTTIVSHLDANRRHDAVLLFDVADGNPNGDPDAGNLPRVDPETMQGLVSDVAIKRKIRDWVDATRGSQERFKIYVQQGAFLSDKQERAYSERNLKKGSKEQKDQQTAQNWMCENFFDVRTFGAVMGVTDYKAGQVRGPVQFTFARSIDPIVPMDVSITRVALTNAKEERQATDANAEGATHGTMGRKTLVPYGLYRAQLFINPHFGKRTGFDEADLAAIWEALERMWDLDRSASRGMTACRGLYVFSHDSALGNAPAHTLFDRVTVARRPGVAAPRAFADYEVRIDDGGLPTGVALTRLVG